MNIFQRLWKGEERLVIAYWLYLFIGSIVFSIVFVLLDYLGQSKPYVYYPLLIIYIAYMFFMYVAVWRSATHYTGKAFWRILAKIVVVISAILLALQIIGIGVKVFTQPKNNDLKMATIVTAINKNLPTMADSVTQLNHVTYENGKFIYHFNITTKKASDLDSIKFNELMSNKIVKSACKEPSIAALLSENITVIFSYDGNDNKNITDVVINPGDCK